MIDEVQCQCLIRRKRAEWVTPIHILVTRIRNIELPPTLHGQCSVRFGIYEHDHLGGIQPYLLVAATPYEVPPELIATCIDATEPEPHHIQWFGLGRGRIDTPKKSYSINTTINLPHLRDLFSHYGDPEPGGAGNWLAARLLPRRWPAAVRLWSDPTLLVAYIQLFTRST